MRNFIEIVTFFIVAYVFIGCGFNFHIIHEWSFLVGFGLLGLLIDFGWNDIR